MGTDIYLHPEHDRRQEVFKKKFEQACAMRDKAQTEELKHKHQEFVHLYYNALYETSYIRASIGMVEENALLCDIFPNKFWEEASDKGLSYDFKLRFPENMKKLFMYVLGYYADGRAQDDKVLAQMSQLKKSITSMIGVVERTEGAQVVMSGSSENFTGRILFASSIINFLSKGVQLQEEGKNPTVYISW